MEVAGLATLRQDQIHQIGQRFSATPPVSSIHGFNIFLLNLRNAEEVKIARFADGRITTGRALKRENKILPLSGFFSWVIDALHYSPQLDIAIPYLQDLTRQQGIHFDNTFHARITETIEAMIRDGWIKRKRSDAIPAIQHDFPHVTKAIRPNVPGK